MKYQQPSFSVPGSAGSASYCAEHGHTLPDVRGKCLRCSAKVRAVEVVNAWLPPKHDNRPFTGRAEDCEGPSFWAETGEPVVEIYSPDGALLSSNRPGTPCE